MPCLKTSVAMAGACAPLYGAMKGAGVLGSRASRAALARTAVASPQASKDCTKAANTFFDMGCACQSDVVAGVRVADAVPLALKEALATIASRCAPGDDPAALNVARAALAESLAAERAAVGAGAAAPLG